MTAASSAAPKRSRKPGIVAAIELAMDPEGFFARNAARLGETYRMALPGIGDVLVSETPDAARELFSAPPDTFTPLDVNPVEPLLGEHSLLLLHGERHRRERKLMMPSFGGDRMRAYGSIMCRAALEEASTWHKGERVELQRAMRSITLGVILGAVVGVEGRDDLPAFRKAVSAMLDAYVPPLLVLPALRTPLLGLSPWARFEAARARVCELFRGEIDRRRREGDAAIAARDDILSLLMQARYDDGTGLTVDELVDEMRTLLVGGHDTTATALVWAFHYAHADASLLARLRDEVDAAHAPADLEKAPLLGAVCNEALRMHPVVPIVPRKVVRPFTYCGQAMREGDRIALCIARLHRRPEIYADPDRFDADRFLRHKFGPFELAPFGGGARRCVGAAFGAYQMRMVLGTIVHTADLGALPRGRGREPTRRLGGITMGPGCPVELTYVGAR